MTALLSLKLDFLCLCGVSVRNTACTNTQILQYQRLYPLYMSWITYSDLLSTTDSQPQAMFINCFYTLLFSALKQTHCANVTSILNE